MHLVKWNEKIKEFQTPEKKWNIQLDSNYSLQYFTSILNSRLCTYFFSKFLSTDTLQGSYSSIYPEDIRQIPIKTNQRNLITIIESLAESILSLKKQNPAADTSDLEAKIDVMVYKLYDLTFDEVKIVDPEFSMSEEEYKEFKFD
jgi:hypothetical protein